VKPVAPNLWISRIVFWMSSSSCFGCLVDDGVAFFELLPELSLRSRSRLREVEPPTVVKSGKAEGQTTTWISRFRFLPEGEEDLFDVSELFLMLSLSEEILD